MKKSRFLVISVVVAVMLVGAGYATFTDTVILTSRVETGDVDVDFKLVNESYDHDWTEETTNTSLPDWINGETGFNEPSLSLNDNKITYNNTNFYPGGAAQLWVDVANNGSVPAKLSDVTITKTLDTSPSNNMLSQFLFSIDEGTTWVSHSSICSELESVIGADIIEPNDTKRVKFAVMMRTSAGNEYQNRTLKFDIEFDFVNYND